MHGGSFLGRVLGHCTAWGMAGVTFPAQLRFSDARGNASKLSGISPYPVGAALLLIAHSTFISRGRGVISHLGDAGLPNFQLLGCPSGG